MALIVMIVKRKCALKACKIMFLKIQVKVSTVGDLFSWPVKCKSRMILK